MFPRIDLLYVWGLGWSCLFALKVRYHTHFNKQLRCQIAGYDLVKHDANAFKVAEKKLLEAHIAVYAAYKTALSCRSTALYPRMAMHSHERACRSSQGPLSSTLSLRLRLS